MRAKRFVAAAVLGLVAGGLAVPPAAAAEKTVLSYDIKDARAFLWNIHYPQTSFMTEFYSPCQAEDEPPTGKVIPNPGDPYHCDRTRYNQTPHTCGEQALGRKEEAPETPTAADVEGGVDQKTGSVGTAEDWPTGNPVAVIHGLALGRLGSSPESGGLASMRYHDNSGRSETEAHVESDGYVGNRQDYEERCDIVDALSEGRYLVDWIPQTRYPGPFAAHMLSRADQTPSTYSMAAFRPAIQTAEPLGYPPGQPGESVSIVKLWQAGGRVHGLLTSTVRAAKLADQITVDVVRSIISFSSDGTEKGLKAEAKTEALRVRIGDIEIASLKGKQVIDLGNNSFLGVLRPVIQVSDDGHEINIRAPGLFLAANTRLSELPIPEDPFQREDALPRVDDPLPEVRGTVGDVRDELCARAGEGRPDPNNSIAKGGCRITLGGRLFGQQVVYVAGAILDAGVGRVPAFSLPPLPPLPKFPPLPSLTPPSLTPPSFTNTTLPVPSQPVALPRFVVREIGGSPWALITILAFTVLGFLAVMGRWSMRYAWAQSLSRVPPFPAVGWTYRAFLKD